MTMNRKLTLLCALLLTTFAMFTQNKATLLRVKDNKSGVSIPKQTESQTGIPDLSSLFGYANKNVDIAKAQWIGTDENMYLTPAIELPKMGEGNFLRGITFAYHDNVEPNGRIVLMEENSYGQGEVIVSKKVNIQAGWNSFLFDTPIKLDSSKKYLLGYCIYAKAGKKGNAPICSDHENKHSIKAANRWGASAKYMEEGDITDFINVAEQIELGNFMIYADIDDSASPIKNMAILLGVDKLDTDANSPYDLAMTVRNPLKNDIQKVKCHIKWDDDTETDLTAANTIKQNETVKVIAHSAEGKNTSKGYFWATLTKVNDADNTLSDNTIISSYIFSIPKTSIIRQGVLLEEFSSENCDNCPRTNLFIENLLKIASSEGKAVNIISYHFNDPFSIKEGADVFSRALKTGYYPSCSFDRQVMRKSTQEIAFPPSKQMLIDKYHQALEVKQPVVFNEATQKITDNNLNLHISGKVKDPTKYDDVYLTAVMTESDITPIKQLGSYKGYVHKDVARLFATPANGMKLSPDKDGIFSVDLNNIQLNANWNRANMKVVIFVSRNLYNEGFENREVWASVSSPLGINLSNKAIENDKTPNISIDNGNISISESVENFALYDMMGRIVTTKQQTLLAPGYYVVSFVYNQKQYTHKIIIK